MVFETITLPFGQPSMASPAGIEPTLRDPQSRGLSISLRGQHQYFTLNSLNILRKIKIYPEENFFADLQSSGLTVKSWESHKKADI